MEEQGKCADDHILPLDDWLLTYFCTLLSWITQYVRQSVQIIFVVYVCALKWNSFYQSI